MNKKTLLITVIVLLAVLGVAAALYPKLSAGMQTQQIATMPAATAEPTQAPGLSQRMSAAFSESAQNLQLFVHDMAVSLMIIAPFALAVLGLAAAITVIVLVIRHHWKKRKNRNS